MKRIYPGGFIAVSLLILFSSLACQNPKNKYGSPQGYDFLKPDKFTMPSSLLEISGIAFHQMNSDTIYSIQDEDGKLFRQKWDVKKQKNMKFGPKGDYEDLAIFHEKVFVLKSNGAIYSFPFEESVKEESDKVKETKHLIPKAEYESLYADEESNKLYVLCKNCPVDKKNKQVTGYILNYEVLSDSLSLLDSFKVDLTQLKTINAKLKTSLSPSALTKNPRTKEWYILSSANKLLIITNPQWKIKEAHKLNSSTFNQPEGLAFDKDLNLYISNEGDEITDGNVIKFKYTAKGKK